MSPLAGRRVDTSIAMPVTVLITAKASLPASMQRRVFSLMSVWLGDILVISGLLVTARQAATTRADISGTLPNCTPPSLMLGQDMLISIASMGESSKRRVTSTYSSTVEPQALAMKRVSVKSSEGRMERTTASTPGFCRPMALSMPSYVSATRCGGLPSLALPVVPLSTIAPTSRFEKPATRVYSSPNPTQPDSSTIGLAKLSPQKRSASEAAGGVWGVADRAGEAFMAGDYRLKNARV